MQLEIFVPSGLFAAIADVTSVVVDTTAGSVGFLKQRLDCIAVVVPGILTYRTLAGTTDVALDKGVLIKTGGLIVISVRHALHGGDLSHLNESIRREFLALDAEQIQVRTAVAKMESGLLARFRDLRHAQ